jgi:hypothetical protein
MLGGAPPEVLRPGFMWVSRGSEVGFGLRGALGVFGSDIDILQFRYEADLGQQLNLAESTLRHPADDE